MSRDLVTICTEVPTEITVGELERKDIDRNILEPIFNELELFSLVRRVLNAEPQEKKTEQLQDVQVDYRDYTGKEAKLAAVLETAECFALHAVFRSGTLYDARPSQLCFSMRTHEAGYVNLPAEEEKALKVIRLFAEIFAQKEKVLVSMDTKSDVIWLKRAGIPVGNRIFRCEKSPTTCSSRTCRMNWNG